MEKSGLYHTNQIGIFDISETEQGDFAANGYVAYESIESLVMSSSVVVVVTPQVIDLIVPKIKSGL